MKAIIFQIIIMLLLFVSCQSRTPDNTDENLKEQKIKSMEMIELNLKKQLLTERQEPFITREFDPYLNGKWIGKAISYGFYRKGQAPGIKGPSESKYFRT